MADKRPLKDLLHRFFGERALDPKVWDRALELMEPFVVLRDRGKFLDQPIAPELITAALEVLDDSDIKWEIIQGKGLYEACPEDFIDLTDALRVSPLRVDIKLNSMFNGMGYIMGDIFMTPAESSLESALKGLLPMWTRLRPRGRIIRTGRYLWLAPLRHNYGCLFVFLLWHASKGHAAEVERLAPLCALMAQAPLVGKRKTDGVWLVLSPQKPD
jgi:hypothetical protein